MAVEWKNWAGSVTAMAARIETPDSEDALIATVQTALADGLRVRAAGEGHSFMPLVSSDGLIVDLRALTGIIEVSDIDQTARIYAGTRIKDMGLPLREAGFALANQGDVDVQAIVGALSTGTHGTGPTLANLSSSITAARVINPAGEVVEINETTADLLNAFRVSTGMFGVVIDVTLKVVPTYRLHEKQWTAEVDQCFEEIDHHIAGNRHFEFFWAPESDRCLMKTLSITEAAPDPMEDVKQEYIDHAHLVFPTERTVKFNEMEFSVPYENGPDCFVEIRKMMQEKHPEVAWPIEYRTVAGDPGFISAQHERKSMAISVHQAAETAFDAFFRDTEAIFRRYKGRPHWGKINYFTTEDCEENYPMWEKFLECRREFDPEGKFLNDHLANIFN